MEIVLATPSAFELSARPSDISFNGCVMIDQIWVRLSHVQTHIVGAMGAHEKGSREEEVA